MYSYLVGTTQYHRSTGGEDCRVTASANNVCFLLLHKILQQLVALIQLIRNKRPYPVARDR